MVKLLDDILQHVRATPDIRVATLLGSHARSWLRAQNQADAWSDIDLQIVTTMPRSYADFAWFRAVPNHAAQVWVRRPVFGGVSKYTVLYEAGELDLVILPYTRMRVGRLLFRLGAHRRIGAVRRALSNFGDLMRFEHVVVKGGPEWTWFYRAAGLELPRLGLDDAQVRSAGDLAYVEASWILGRISRGELISTQRVLHQVVVETNIRLLHEWRERRGLPAHHKARRSEMVLPPEELRWVRVDAKLDARSLAEATRTMIDGTRRLVQVLTGSEPDWPRL